MGGGMQGTREHSLVDTQPDISSPWGRTHRHGGSQQNFPSCGSCSSSSRVRQSLYILIKFLSCIDSRRSWQILGFLDFKMSAQNGRDIVSNSMSICATQDSAFRTRVGRPEGLFARIQGGSRVTTRSADKPTEGHCFAGSAGDGDLAPSSHVVGTHHQTSAPA